MPAAFYNRPEIEPHLRLFWEAFWELSTERQIGMGVGPIPRSKIREYLREELELSGSYYRHAYAVLCRTDAEYTSMVNSTAPTGPSKGEFAASDTSSMRQMFAGMATKSKQKKQKK